jgi:hypothetical protein
MIQPQAPLPGEAELPMLCEAYHQRVAEIFNNLQLAALGRALF